MKLRELKRVLCPADTVTIYRLLGDEEEYFLDHLQNCKVGLIDETYLDMFVKLVCPDRDDLYNLCIIVGRD